MAGGSEATSKIDAWGRRLTPCPGSTFDTPRRIFATKRARAILRSYASESLVIWFFADSGLQDVVAQRQKTGALLTELDLHLDSLPEFIRSPRPSVVPTRHHVLRSQSFLIGRGVHPVGQERYDDGAFAARGQAFFTALESIPEATRPAVTKAALAMIRDQIKMQREKVKAVTAKEKAAAAKAKASKPVADKPVAKAGPKAKVGVAASKAAPVKRRATKTAKPVDVPVTA